MRIGWLGPAGDDHADKANHGGSDQAVYAYAREDLDWWTERIHVNGGQKGQRLGGRSA